MAKNYVGFYKEMENSDTLINLQVSVEFGLVKVHSENTVEH